MKYSFLLIFLIFFSCNQKENIFYLEYTKKGDSLYLNFKNETNNDIVFLTPNILQFRDQKLKTNSTIGIKENDFPITVYAEIIKNQQNFPYQKKLDSILKHYIAEMQLESAGNSEDKVFLIQKKKALIVKYKLSVKENFNEKYTSYFTQKYFPYSEVLEGKFYNSKYLQRFSKLNFGKAKFIAQPIIKDSLILKISEKDITN